MTVTTTIPVIRGEAIPAAKPARYYHPELDVLRFAAFASVFFHHSLPRGPEECRTAFCSAHGTLLKPFYALITAAGAGMPLFFTLSAFLIATLLLRERSTTGRIHLAAFYLRRALRIWPLYYAALAIALVFALAGRFPEQASFVGAMAAFAGDWFLTVSPQADLALHSPFHTLWSISVEEQFYLLFPIVLASWSRMPVVAVGVATVIGSSAALFAQGQQHLLVQSTIWFNGFSQAIFFGAGLCLAAALGRRRIVMSDFRRVALLLGSAAVIYLAVAFLDVKRAMPAQSGLAVVSGYALTALGCAGLIASLYDAEWRFPRRIVYLGKISFGLYVFHMAFMDLFLWLFSLAHLHVGGFPARLVSLAATIAVATLSYERFEKPFLRLKERFAFVASRPD